MSWKTGQEEGNCFPVHWIKRKEVTFRLGINVLRRLLTSQLSNAKWHNFSGDRKTCFKSRANAWWSIYGSVNWELKCEEGTKTGVPVLGQTSSPSSCAIQKVMFYKNGATVTEGFFRSLSLSEWVKPNDVWSKLLKLNNRSDASLPSTGVKEVKSLFHSAKTEATDNVCYHSGGF